jgi:hypothetical protein
MLTIEDYVIRNWQRLSPINSWISGDPIMSKSETTREPLIFSCEMPEGDREAQAIFVCMEMLNTLACQPAQIRITEYLKNVYWQRTSA